MHKEKNIEKKETLEKNTKIESKENNSVQEKTITLKEAEYNELLQYKERIKDYEEKILRLQADFDNMLKRMEREKQEFARFANQGIILDLLNILDDLERSINMAQEKHIDFPVFLKGIEIILAHLYELLKKYGVKPIESEGKIFD
ncbi:MAG: nucleotide exchange factor GrpE, partial [Candidatus Omnitrophica bacterium]|nr:nucleotide exchange factor GrpE [Candidatus Omnitrophota bacterium]